MALSRIWSAFIIIAIVVGGFKLYFSNDSQIFSRMVTGKSDDAYDSISYIMAGKPEKFGFASPAAFSKFIEGYGYIKKDSVKKASVLIIDDIKADTVAAIRALNPSIKIFTYRSIQSKLVKKADGIIETCKSAVMICINLIGIMALFMGFLSIAEAAGGIRLLSKIVGPFFSKLFPELPKDHPAMGHMLMNFSANLLNLDNAATPFGIKAMESLQEINPDKDTASNSQIMFLCLHAAGLTLIPVTIIAARSALKAHSATEIFVPCMIATFIATIAAMVMVAIKQKINLFQPIILAWVGGGIGIIALLVIYLNTLSSERVQSFSGSLSNGIILMIFLLITAGALYKKINVFDSFVEGAKGGFETAIRIIPYLVGMLVAISMLRTSGTFEAVISGMKHLFTALGMDTRFVDGLPTALIKPLSGSAARGMMIDTMKNFSPDSFAGRLSCILQGSSDTTFYVVAVYFGAVSIKNTRYSISIMLLADLVGILSSIGLCYMFFG